MKCSRSDVRRHLLCSAAFFCILGFQVSAAPTEEPPPGMRWIPWGEVLMGTDDERSFPNERPAHRVRVDGFWMDDHPITNAEFFKFVEATGYLTTAERKVEWEELKKELPPNTPKP